MEDFGTSISRIGLIADTHVPDRCNRLHTQIIPRFKELGVELILHAGDICSPSILKELSSVATVRAVRGNRDLFGLSEHPFAALYKVQGLTIGMTHGHGNLFKYLLDKVKYVVRGPQVFAIARYRSLEMFSKAPDILVYGHNHHPEILELDSTLVINPGSPCRNIPRNLPPSIGFIEIRDGKASPQLISLENRIT